MQAFVPHYNIYYQAFLSYKSHKIIYSVHCHQKNHFNLKKEDLVYQNTSYIYLLFFKNTVRLLLKPIK